MYCSIFHPVFTCVHTIVCLLDCLVFLRFGIKYIYACLLYFLAGVLRFASLVFLPNYSCLSLPDVLQILVGATSSSFVGVLPLCLPFRCFGDFSLLYFCVPFSFCAF